ncbi:alpha/beta hydrolase [Euzebya rosea]|uniref:alpha/beta hydrolase n=1 Tax=Euzebya rosea TaxID=2052804 RepID=UPI001300A1DC|nr:alpha/beta fold hydrolase [Euzebya rosea]
MTGTGRLWVGLGSTFGALATALVVGGGFVYTGQLLPASARDRTLDTTATLADDGTVRLPAERRACLEHIGLLLPDGYVRIGGPVEGTCDGDGTVVRTVLAIDEGDPATGVTQPARFDEYIWHGPPSRVGLSFEDVVVPTERGDAPAWLLPGEGDRWAIVVHGRTGTREESLRILPTLVAHGLHTLAITHRNDFAGGPPAADGTGRYGASEWPDLAAAVDWARARGARDIVLVGFSQGGSLIGYLLRERGPDHIAGIVLDSPLLSLPETLVLQARRRNIPGPIVPPILFGTQQVARLQADFDVADVEHVDTFAGSDVPLLLFHGPGDDFVPVGPSDRLAAARTRAMTYERLPTAGHVEGFNADADRYTTAVTRFLEGL